MPIALDAGHTQLMKERPLSSSTRQGQSDLLSTCSPQKRTGDEGPKMKLANAEPGPTGLKRASLSMQPRGRNPLDVVSFVAFNVV